jgi:hypothetical protein
MADTLKQCPFCGSCETGIHSQEHMGYCLNCGAFGPSRGNKSDAADAWDNRPLEHDLQAEVATLKELVREMAEAIDGMNPYLATEASMLDNASLNEGQACHYDVASLKVRKVLAKSKEALNG